MSRGPSNPYASNPYQSAGGPPSAPGAAYAEAAYATPPRTSVAAVFSFLCSIPCCFIPGLGVLGILLGALSVSFIARARGRLSGRGLAIAGIILGIISTTLWVAGGIGMAQVYTFWMKQMLPAASGIVVAAAEDKHDEARGFMTSAAAAEVDDARLAAFAQAIEVAHGEVLGPSGDFWMLVKSFQRTLGNSGGNVGSGSAQGAYTIAPFAFETAAGPTLGWAMFSSSALQSQKAEVEDLLIYLDPGTSTGITLRKDGPAVGLAASMGVTIVEPQDAVKKKESAPTAPAPPPAPASPPGS